MQNRVFLVFLLFMRMAILPMRADENIVAVESIASFGQAVMEIVNDGDNTSDALRFLTVNKADRRLMGQMKAIVGLKDQNPAIRKSSYLTLGGSDEPYVMQLFERQIKIESDPSLRVIVNDSYNKLLLTSGDETAQSKALEYFTNRKTAETMSLLNQYVDNGQTTAANVSKAHSIISSIKKKERVINTAQNLFSGISLGSILILVALGLSIIYGLAGVINMSHGEFLMIGAYTTYCIQEVFINFFPQSWFDAYFFVSLPVSFIVAGLVGLLLERLVIRHLYSRPLESLLATLGISLILIQIARNIFGDLTSVKAPSLLNGGITLFDGFVLPYNRLFIIALTIVVVLAMYFTFQRTRLGIKIRAVTQNRDMSACVGISTKKIDAMTFFIGSGIAGMAGCALTLIGNVVPNMGQTYIVDSFLVVVTGGVGKLVGCITSGLGIGTLSKVFEIFFETIYGKVLMLALIIFFLQYKPKGLFPDKGRIGDD